MVYFVWRYEKGDDLLIGAGEDLETGQAIANAHAGYDLTWVRRDSLHTVWYATAGEATYRVWVTDSLIPPPEG